MSYLFWPPLLQPVVGGQSVALPRLTTIPHQILSVLQGYLTGMTNTIRDKMPNKQLKPVDTIPSSHPLPLLKGSC